MHSQIMAADCFANDQHNEEEDPNRNKVNKVTINAPSIAAILSFCIFFHYQCTAGDMRIPSGRHPIFAMGGLPHHRGPNEPRSYFVFPTFLYSIGWILSYPPQ